MGRSIVGIVHSIRVVDSRHKHTPGLLPLLTETAPALPEHRTKKSRTSFFVVHHDIVVARHPRPLQEIDIDDGHSPLPRRLSIVHIDDGAIVAAAAAPPTRFVEMENRRCRRRRGRRRRRAAMHLDLDCRPSIRPRAAAVVVSSTNPSASPTPSIPMLPPPSPASSINDAAAGPSLRGQEGPGVDVPRDAPSHAETAKEIPQAHARGGIREE